MQDHTEPLDQQQLQPSQGRGRRTRPRVERHVKWAPGQGLEISNVETIVRETAPATNETQRQFNVGNRLPGGSNVLSPPSQEELTRA